MLRDPEETPIEPYQEARDGLVRRFNSIDHPSSISIQSVTSLPNKAWKGACTEPVDF